jgi:hypothetical protein
MPRRYVYTRRRRRDPDQHRRTVFMRPGVQMTILLVAALVVFLLLQSGGR